MSKQALYECKKCGAVVESSDNFCPNGHDLSKVGRNIKLTLGEVITLSDEAVNASSFMTLNIDRLIQSLEETSTITPEIQDDIKSLKKQGEGLENILERVESLLNIVKDQTKSLSVFGRIKENFLDYLITAAIAFIVGSFF